MKIAITNALLPTDQCSGVPFQVHHLANALCRRGHDVTVFTFSPRPADAQYAVHQFPRPNVLPRFFAFIMAYRLATTDFSSYDVINVHGDNYLMWSPRPIVRTFSGTASDEFRTAKTLQRRLFCALSIPLEHIGAALADHVVGISEATRARMPAVTTIIPCGVDLDAFVAGAKTEKPTVLFVGSELGRKRGKWLAETFKAKVKPRLPDAELLIISDSTLVEPGVRRFGRVSAETLAELYRSSWVFCLPSTYEGFGVPYIEAMAARTAVVATSPNPGAREVLADGAFGMFVEDDKLGDALVRLLSDSALREELVFRGAERSRTFAWENIARMYETLFERVITAKKAAKNTAHRGIAS
jgi:glycosyltransferase involved in cell wall biosynthesis